MLCSCLIFKLVESPPLKLTHLKLIAYKCAYIPSLALLTALLELPMFLEVTEQRNPYRNSCLPPVYSYYYFTILPYGDFPQF